MANLDFYATAGDHEALLADLFQQGDLRIFESYSALDRDLREFTEAGQLLDELRAAEHARWAVCLQIWAPTASRKVEVERFWVSARNAHRHRIAGWGLMQLYLSKETDAEINVSHFGHFNQRSAENRSTPAYLGANPGTAADWDWDELRRISRRIQYRIRARFSDIKVRSRPVLRGAAHLMQSGHRLALKLKGRVSEESVVLNTISAGPAPSRR